ncbi:MAG: S-layer homology domain-containing protein [Clostridiales Family XIII bacterium]|jgi:hypothetical protein|nr:S-layer homology domain-containing protein [Clostridiales Family XIII bacterium]
MANYRKIVGIHRGSATAPLAVRAGAAENAEAAESARTGVGAKGRGSGLAGAARGFLLAALIAALAFGGIPLGATPPNGGQAQMPGWAPALPVAYAAEETSHAVSLLSAIGVISRDSAGSFNLSRPVTRAEFTKMLITASPYKDLISGASSSLFKDVPAAHWASPYIKLALTNGLVSGYSDGSFKPDNNITLEQAANTVLKALGYTNADFRGAYPDAQMNLFRSGTLSTGVAGGVGTIVTRGDAANIIYNMLNTKTKDGTGKYAEALGYKLNAAGEVDYAAALSSNMIGPFTVKGSSWASETGLAGLTYSVYKNGKEASAPDIRQYDVLYFNASRTVVWVYDRKITGVYEKASPSQNDVTHVTVSGKEYPLESANAFAALSSSGTLRTGNTVTLLIGKDGGVADAVAGSAISSDAVIYITETGNRSYVNAAGQSYNSAYIKGVTTAGDELEYPVSPTQSWAKKGLVAKVGFEGGSTSVSKVSGGVINGAGNAASRRIGQFQLAEDARIMDTDSGAYTSVSIQRLDGVTIGQEKVLYYETSGGNITSIILDNATGDCASYGIITAARSSSSEASVSGEYSWMIDGVPGSASSMNSAFKINTGAARILLSGGGLESVRNLDRISGKVQRFDANTLAVSESPTQWNISPNVGVYTVNAAGQYAHSTLADAEAAFRNGQTVDFYSDGLPANGGQARIIIIRSR